jgi:hypothetical protein
MSRTEVATLAALSMSANALTWVRNLESIRLRLWAIRSRRAGKPCRPEIKKAFTSTGSGDAGLARGHWVGFGANGQASEIGDPEYPPPRLR